MTQESELGQAYRYLANYHLQQGHHNDAVIAANKCLDFPEIREEAKALCRQLTLLSGAAKTAAEGDASATSAAAGDNEEATSTPSSTGKHPHYYFIIS